MNVRKGSGEEITLVQVKEQRLRFAEASVKRYPMPKVNIYLFLLCLFILAAQAFSNCSEQGLLFVVAHGLLIAVASLLVEHRL